VHSKGSRLSFLTERTLRRGVLLLFLLVASVAAFLYLLRPTRDREALRDLSVILITVDTLRADHVGVYGKGRAVTPHLDALAHDGAVFERCIAQTPLTLPSHTTLLSGTYPLRHQLRDNGSSVVPTELTLLSEVLKEKGYDTAAFIGAYVLHSKWGLNQGFDTYADDFERSRYQRLRLQNEKRADEVIAEAKSWIESRQGRPFFAWVHLYDPHAPYNPPAPFDRYPAAPYRGEVEYCDRVLGDFFDFLRKTGILDRSLVVVTSDHGEGLGEHGEDEHGFFVYESTVRVPLILRSPFGFPVKRVPDLVELVDVAPTILDALEIPKPSESQGESLLPFVFGEPKEAEGTAYAETFYPRMHYGWADLKAFYHGEWKYVQAPGAELYRLSDDPGESTNLATDLQFEERRKTLDRAARRFVASRSEGAVLPGSAGLRPDDIQRLRTLGYVTTRVTTDERSSFLPDPKDKVEVYRALLKAFDVLEAGQFDQAIAAARAVIRTEPSLVEAHILLGNALQRKGELREAVRTFSRILELKPDANFTMIDLVGALISLGEFDRAAEKASRFLEQFKDDPILLEELGFARLSLREYDAALDAFERAITLEPGPTSLTKAGEVLANQKRYDEAESYLHRALDLDPKAREAHYVLAHIDEARGNITQAKDHYARELDNDPRNYKAAFNLAVLFKKEGDVDSAIRYYRNAIDANPGFNMPYFMIATFLVERRGDTSEAIRLCEQGIRAMPKDRSALLGYQTLMQIFAQRGDRASYERNAARAQALLKATGEKP